MIKRLLRYLLGRRCDICGGWHEVIHDHVDKGRVCSLCMVTHWADGGEVEVKK